MNFKELENMEKPKRPYLEEVWIDFDNMEALQKLMFDKTKTHFPGMEGMFITGIEDKEEDATT